MSDVRLGSGRIVVPGDVAVCHGKCSRRNGDHVFSSEETGPWTVRVGARDSYVGIEYGLMGMRIGGIRTVIVPPNLTYDERKTFSEIPLNAILVYEIELIELKEQWDPEMRNRLSQRHARRNNSE